MVQTKKKKSIVDVNIRIRPLTGNELKREDDVLALDIDCGHKRKYELGLTTPKTLNDDIEYVEILGGFKVPKSKPQRNKKYRGFAHIAKQDTNNEEFFQKSVLPLVEDVLKGKTACCFAYGHTGSGKTHTILGCGNEAGMYHEASKTMFEAMEEIKQLFVGETPKTSFDQDKDAPVIQVRFNEIYNDNVYDLLNGNQKCFVREDDERKIQIRGETITDEGGFVHSSYATKLYAKTHDELLDIVTKGIAARATGNSNVHEHSSRSHAILELEIVSQRMAEIDETIRDLEAKAIHVGHKRDNLQVDIFNRQHEKVEGKWRRIANARGATSDECETLSELAKDLSAIQNRILAETERLKETKSSGVPCLGGTLVFVDLAGSEHAGNATDGIQKTEQEQQECRQINLSLSALKGCFRALANGTRSMSCYRQSKLTLVLRDHLRCNESKTLMVTTISPSVEHTNKTIHTMQYAQIVAEC